MSVMTVKIIGTARTIFCSISSAWKNSLADGRFTKHFSVVELSVSSCSMAWISTEENSRETIIIQSSLKCLFGNERLISFVMFRSKVQLQLDIWYNFIVLFIAFFIYLSQFSFYRFWTIVSIISNYTIIVCQYANLSLKVMSRYQFR